MGLGIRLSRQRKNTLFALLLILPAVLLLSLTIISPLIKALIMSFQNNSLMSQQHTWNGLGNYIYLLKDRALYHSFKVTLVYVMITVAIEFILGMIMALVLQMPIMFRTFFRSILMIPWTIPMIVASLIFMWVYQQDYGVLNYILVHLGIVSENINWLTNRQFALMSIIIVAVWRQTPLMGLMLLAGLQSISKSLYEAARIDGAGAIQTFFRITLPALKPMIGTVTLMLIVTNFQMFTLFFTLTGGGPVDATKSLAIFTYETAFQRYDLGMASTIGVIWLIVLFGFSGLYTKLFHIGKDR